MEERYGKSERIWVMDRGMSSADNIEFLKEGNRRYIIGTSKGMLREYEQQIISQDWTKIGRRWGSGASRLVWAMSQGRCWMRLPR